MKLKRKDSLTSAFNRVDTKHHESLWRLENHSKELKQLPKKTPRTWAFHLIDLVPGIEEETIKKTSVPVKLLWNLVYDIQHVTWEIQYGLFVILITVEYLSKRKIEPTWTRRLLPRHSNLLDMTTRRTETWSPESTRVKVEVIRPKLLSMHLPFLLFL